MTLADTLINAGVTVAIAAIMPTIVVFLMSLYFLLRDVHGSEEPTKYEISLYLIFVTLAALLLIVGVAVMAASVWFQ